MQELLGPGGLGAYPQEIFTRSEINSGALVSRLGRL